MSLPTIHGAVKEVWFAPLSNPSDKHLFYARGDAYTKAVAQLGRTIRLGDPVDLGPNGTFRQTSWEGGFDQQVWHDTQMYEKGTADTAVERGQVRLNPAFEEISSATRTGVSRYAFGRNATGLNPASIDLFYGESNLGALTAPGTPSGGYRVYRLPGSTGVEAVSKGDFNHPIAAFSPINDSSPAIIVATYGGEMWVFDGSTWTLEHTLIAQANQHGMLYFNKALYIASINRVAVRRTTSADPTPKYSTFYTVGAGGRVTGIVNWNNRMWFGAALPGQVTVLYVSDGVTTNEALTFPGQFDIQGMIPHYGSLFIYGGKMGADGASTVGQVWKYTGASLSLLYESGKGNDGENHNIWDAQVDGPFLLWGQHAHASNGWRAGLVRYDAEVDALSFGPGITTTGTTTYIRSLIPHDSTFHVSAFQPASGTIRHWRVRKLGQVRSPLYSGSTVEQYVLSSQYDGDLPAEEKLWTAVRLHLRIKDAGAEVVVKAVLDKDEANEVTVGTIGYDSTNKGWRSVRLPTLVNGKFLRSTLIQYKLYLRNTSSDSNSTATPEVDSLEVDFIPAAKRYFQWRMRLVASDGLTPALDTKQKIVEKLESYWGQPILFWEGTSEGSPPSGAGTAVMLNEYAESPYRLDTNSMSENADIGIGFLGLEAVEPE